ncbi:MAG: FAD-binding protein [Frankiales bacterium]|nr:FAD-binding protein [Frankiales bacterium]
MTQWNWAHNHAYAHERWAEPADVDELAGLVTSATRVRAVGSRHSFNELCDSDDLVVDLARLRQPPAVDPERRVVTVSPGVRFGDVARAVAEHGLALRNLGSLPHISVVGATATGTHGSGIANPVLATAVSRVRLVRADGSTSEHRRGDAGFPATVLSLGAAGIAVDMDLDLVPEFWIRQTREPVSLPDLLDDAEHILSEGYSVSIFTRWAATEQSEVLRKTAVDPGSPGPLPAASVPSLLLGDGDNLTPTDEPLLWHDGLPHFRLDHQPSFGAEIQSEWFVPRERTAASLHAVAQLAPELAPHLLVSEIRSIAADELWLSPAQGRDSTCLHFTWKQHPEAVARLVRQVGTLLEPHSARPHWGKVFTADQPDWASLYPHLPDFVHVVEELDPAGTFRNRFLNQVLGTEA